MHAKRHSFQVDFWTVDIFEESEYNSSGSSSDIKELW